MNEKKLKKTTYGGSFNERLTGCAMGVVLVRSDLREVESGVDEPGWFSAVILFFASDRVRDGSTIGSTPTGKPFELEYSESAASTVDFRFRPLGVGVVGKKRSLGEVARLV
jgi:hypothetical protein